MFTKPTYLVKEHYEGLRVVSRYDIIDPETGQPVAYAEENIPGFTKFMRWIISKSLMSTTIEIKSAADNSIQYYIKKPGTFLRATVTILDKNQRPLGYFKSRIMTLGGAFDVYDTKDQKVAEVKGDWKGWNFKFTNNSGQEIGMVTKQWGGIGRELFTTADNYIISINPSMTGSPDMMALLLMAGLAIDTVYKERN